jgi:hypothetical protein
MALTRVVSNGQLTRPRFKLDGVPAVSSGDVRRAEFLTFVRTDTLLDPGGCGCIGSDNLTIALRVLFTR